MPNHFHAIIVINRAGAEQAGVERAGAERADMESAPTVSEIIQSFKRYSTIEYIKLVKKGILPPFNQKLWQRSFHDHIIRNQREYEMIWEYIDKNALKWKADCFYNQN